jgi:hypothetical protein
MAKSDFLHLRRRSGWEAADSGVLLWRRNAGALLLFFALPYALLVTGVCFLPQIMLPVALFGLWWLRPLLDRLILHVISVRFFDYDAPLSRLARKLGSSLRAGLAGDLLWRRFSPWRGGRMPEREQEKLTGKAARKRIHVLESGGLGFSLTVTMLGMALNCTLWAGELLFTFIVLDMLVLGSLNDLFENHTRFFFILTVAMSEINFLIVESLYICMSFGVYINSRLETEGWDLQLDFQRFAGQRVPAGPAAQDPGKAQRFGETRTGVSPLPGVVKILVLAVLLPGFRAHPLYCGETGQNNSAPPGAVALNGAPGAAENAPVLITKEDAALETLDTVLSSPDFGAKKDTWRIRFKESEEEPGAEEPDFSELRRTFGYAIRALAAALIVAALGFGLYRYLKTGNPLTKSGGWKHSVLAGGERGKSSALLLTEAREFQRQGFIREAWAHCFAAILAAFSERDNFAFPKDATEYGCLALLKTHGVPETAAFNGFLGSWIDLAYGGKTPDSRCFDEALAFCVSIQGPAGE